mmetsp:Transcript_100513/g.313281  ORF Transcript_100513/g.313281 Transcript_100513/m.313281 type:complete len:232 (-) Transcript_100513:860-1555(-)
MKMADGASPSVSRGTTSRRRTMLGCRACFKTFTSRASRAFSSSSCSPCLWRPQKTFTATSSVIPSTPSKKQPKTAANCPRPMQRLTSRTCGRSLTSCTSCSSRPSSDFLPSQIRRLPCNCSLISRTCGAACARRPNTGATMNWMKPVCEVANLPLRSQSVDTGIPRRASSSPCMQNSSRRHWAHLSPMAIGLDEVPTSAACKIMACVSWMATLPSEIHSSGLVPSLSTMPL